MAQPWLQRLLKKSRPLPRSGRKKFWRKRFVPNLEALADRIVPAAFHVTTLTDGVLGSLRDAVTRANAHAGADTIDFQPGLAGTIALTGGELDVTDDLKINGPGAGTLTVSGNHISRVFKVGAGEAVSISGLTIAGGNAGTGNGGGVDNFGALTVSNVVFSGNAANKGGGLANQSGGTATVRDSVFAGNSADAGGGLANGPDTSTTVTVRGSTFTGNTAIAGGGLLNFGGATVTVSGSTFTGNSATLFGGGLDTELGGGTVTVSGCAFTGNSAGSGNGGLNNEAGGSLTQFDNQFIDDQPPDVFP